eukprot:1098567-Prorocentrum_minimum.AAC.1
MNRGSGGDQEGFMRGSGGDQEGVRRGSGRWVRPTQASCAVHTRRHLSRVVVELSPREVVGLPHGGAAPAACTRCTLAILAFMPAQHTASVEFLTFARDPYDFCFFTFALRQTSIHSLPLSVSLPFAHFRSPSDFRSLILAFRQTSIFSLPFTHFRFLFHFHSLTFALLYLDFRPLTPVLRPTWFLFFSLPSPPTQPPPHSTSTSQPWSLRQSAAAVGAGVLPTWRGGGGGARAPREAVDGRRLKLRKGGGAGRRQPGLPRPPQRRRRHALQQSDGHHAAPAVQHGGAGIYANTRTPFKPSNLRTLLKGLLSRSLSRPPLDTPLSADH